MVGDRERERERVVTFNSDQMHTNLKTRSASRHHVITLSRVGVFFQNDRLGQSFKMQYFTKRSLQKKNSDLFFHNTSP